ncbi:Dehydrogenase/reductase SDR family member 7B [Hypsibius exemplaris]|uniref:Dehydrogenase/reductase SDR family member 7B n=1 Tax=Hypsibius exemplaris TaxID=2072580 RepID=A0A1W0WK17_HYPEX|nr:Dehydrogenase/reductase SDR family member 7B [Hypsibius exemplaris]
MSAIAWIKSLEWHQQLAFLIGIGATGSAGWTVYKLLRRRGKKRNLADLVICITGATGGLGRALAETLRERRVARIILTGRNREALQQLIAHLQLIGDVLAAPVVIEMDLLELDTLPGKARDILAVYGRIDVLIHNAGISCRGGVMDTDFAVDLQVMKTNYLAPVLLTKGLLPSMVERGGGCIVAVSSIQGRLAIPFRAAYAASKHSLQAFFDCLRAELWDANVDIVVVSPGYIKTGLSLRALRGKGNAHGKMDEATANGMEARQVAERIVRAIEDREREVLMCGLLPRLALILRSSFPSLYFGQMAKRAKQLKHLERA